MLPHLIELLIRDKVDLVLEVGGLELMVEDLTGITKHTTHMFVSSIWAECQQKVGLGSE